MRAPVLAILLLSAALAGCLTGEQADEDDDGDSRDSDLFIPGEDDEAELPGEDGSNRSFSSPPVLSEGLVWTYDLGGTTAHAEELGVVVARRNASGYLFGGTEPADLPAEIHGDRPWLGGQSSDLNPTGSDRVLFDFPLVDGKTWSWADAEVTAERGEVPTIDGTTEGFEMTLASGELERTWTYAPGIGYLTSYTESLAGTTTVELTITDIGLRSNATWYRSLASLRISGAGPPGAISVGDEADALVLGLTGDRGSQATVSPPLTSGMGPTSYHVQAAYGGAFDRHPPASGDWRLTTTPPPTGSMEASLTSVAWTEIFASG